MKCSRFSEEQIISILKEQEAGQRTADVCHRRGISDATLYKRKAKYGGLEVFDTKPLMDTQDENARLKKLQAEAMLNIDIMKYHSAISSTKKLSIDTQTLTIIK
tara:strand:- start:604 stop:915 length:312 start_codon:yes stop_codon:yes gene_type:complete